MKYWILLLILASCASNQYIEYSQGLPEGEWKTMIATGDVNNDGLIDIAGIGRKGDATAKVWINTGIEWQESTNGIDQKMQCGVGAKLYDINKDGYLDVAYAQHCGGPTAYLGDGKGNWKNHSTALQTTGINALDIGELNNDNKTQMITIGAFIEEGIRIYEYKGTWNEVKTNLPDKIEGSPFSLYMYDTDGDGLKDIVTAHQTAHIYKNKGNYTFEDTKLENATFVTPEDIDGDGKTDYILSGPELKIIYGNGKKESLGKCAGATTVDDMNNDGKKDIIANCDPIKIIQDNKETNIKTPEKPLGIQTADFNNDGKKDIAASFLSGSIKVYIATNKNV